MEDGTIIMMVHQQLNKNLTGLSIKVFYALWLLETIEQEKDIIVGLLMQMIVLVLFSLM